MDINTLDRTTSPAFHTIEQVHIPLAQTYTLANGIPLHVINVGEQPVVKLELSFHAGNWYDTKNGISFFTSKMLNEGTSQHNSNQISEYFDQFGAFTEFTHGVDRASFVVYGLTKYLDQLLPMVQEILNDSIFPEKELNTLKKIQLQTIQVNQEKTSFLANQKIRKSLFGTQHPYGKHVTSQVIEAITREDLVDYYKSHWKNQPCRIFLSGKVTEADIQLVSQAFGDTPLQKRLDSTPTFDIDSAPIAEPILIEKENAMQSSIRLGKKLVTRNHPDYFNLLVTNEVLGGYFGSRLMKNIREDKGFTYGIGSNIVPFSKAGYFIIGTDVKKEFTQQTLDEIRKELHILQTELISSDELAAVRNYMIGAFAGSLNTPFEIADRYKIIMSEGLPLDFYNKYFEHIKSIKPEAILATAQQYLTPESFIEVVAGGK